MYGDKDTFRLAFALADKSASFEQVHQQSTHRPLPEVTGA